VLYSVSKTHKINVLYRILTKYSKLLTEGLTRKCQESVTYYLNGVMCKNTFASFKRWYLTISSHSTPRLLKIKTTKDDFGDILIIRDCDSFLPYFRQTRLLHVSFGDTGAYPLGPPPPLRCDETFWFSQKLAFLPQVQKYGSKFGKKMSGPPRLSQIIWMAPTTSTVMVGWTTITTSLVIKICWRFKQNLFQMQGVDLGSISSTVYKQILFVKIPKAQKKQSSQKCLIALLGSACIKAAPKWCWNWHMVDKGSSTNYVTPFPSFPLPHLQQQQLQLVADPSALFNYS